MVLWHSLCLFAHLTAWIIVGQADIFLNLVDSLEYSDRTYGANSWNVEVTVVHHLLQRFPWSLHGQATFGMSSSLTVRSSPSQAFACSALKFKGVCTSVNRAASSNTLVNHCSDVEALCDSGVFRVRVSVPVLPLDGSHLAYKLLVIPTLTKEMFQY
ncbi:hypothetical protein Tco_1220936 [Tanacetum coccineum]